MNATSFNYSLKNIPIPSKQSYLKSLTDKVESFLKRLRWKAYFFEHPSTKDDYAADFGFASSLTPPQCDSLIPFENDMYEIIRNIKFRDGLNTFQQVLKGDVKNIQSSPNMFVSADKTSNMYEMPRDQYAKLLHDNITKSYQKSDPTIKQNIDREARTLAEPLNLDKKMECYANRPAFITLKDHKENFKAKTPCRLINLSKSEMGRVAKTYLDTINEAIASLTKVNQWKNTSTVINWFKGIPNKDNSRFIKFDIAEFYPSISEELLDKAIGYAKSKTAVTDDVIAIIKHSSASIFWTNCQQSL